MADHWKYRIEAYRRIPGKFSWSPAKDDVADMWLVLGSKGDDHRCFGIDSTRADAERALDAARNRDKEPQHAKDAPRDDGYHISQRRNGTEDEIIIHAPDDRHMAYIQFWDAEYDEPGSGDKEAKADAKLIIDALNAYHARSGSSEQTGARLNTAKAYHASPGRDPFDYEDAIEIRAPDGRSMAFSLLSDQPDQAKADAQLIANALNAYQPRHAPSKEASAAELSAALFGGGDAPKKSPEIQKESPQHERGGRGR